MNSLLTQIINTTIDSYREYERQLLNIDIEEPIICDQIRTQKQIGSLKEESKCILFLCEVVIPLTKIYGILLEIYCKRKEYSSEVKYMMEVPKELSPNRSTKGKEYDEEDDDDDDELGEIMINFDSVKLSLQDAIYLLRWDTSLTADKLEEWGLNFDCLFDNNELISKLTEDKQTQIVSYVKVRLLYMAVDLSLSITIEKPNKDEPFMSIIGDVFRIIYDKLLYQKIDLQECIQTPLFQINDENVVSAYRNNKLSCINKNDLLSHFCQLITDITHIDGFCCEISRQYLKKILSNSSFVYDYFTIEEKDASINVRLSDKCLNDTDVSVTSLVKKTRDALNDYYKTLTDSVFARSKRFPKVDEMYQKNLNNEQWKTMLMFEELFVPISRLWSDVWKRNNALYYNTIEGHDWKPSKTITSRLTTVDAYAILLSMPGKKFNVRTHEFEYGQNDCLSSLDANILGCLEKNLYNQFLIFWDNETMMDLCRENFVRIVPISVMHSENSAAPLRLVRPWQMPIFLFFELQRYDEYCNYIEDNGYSSYGEYMPHHSACQIFESIVFAYLEHCEEFSVVEQKCFDDIIDKSHFMDLYETYKNKYCEKALRDYEGVFKNYAEECSCDLHIESNYLKQIYSTFEQYLYPNKHLETTSVNSFFALLGCKEFVATERYIYWYGSWKSMAWFIRNVLNNPSRKQKPNGAWTQLEKIFQYRDDTVLNWTSVRATSMQSGKLDIPDEELNFLESLKNKLSFLS